MPYTTQFRRTNTVQLHCTYVPSTGKGYCEDDGTWFQEPQETYSYRSSGLDSDGRSLSYDDLPGDQLRAEAMLQSKGMSSGDSGHVFWTWRQGACTPVFQGYVARRPSGNSFHTYTGYILPTFFGSCLAPTPAEPSSSEMNRLGTAGIARLSPANPPIQLMVSLAELYREGLPKLESLQLLRSKLSAAQKGDIPAKEFLNYQFGLTPVAGDIASLASAVLDFQKFKDQYDSLMNAQFRRKGILLDTETTTTGTLTGYGLQMSRIGTSPGSYDQAVPFFFPSSGPNPSYVDVYRKKVWLSCAYTYYMEDLDRYFHNSWVGRAEGLLGLQITPEVIWNLAPWSWLFDWFGNVGKILHNISQVQQYNQVLRYAYLMCQQKVSRSVDRGAVPDWSGASVGPFVTQSSSVRKDRLRASPYGFGVSASSFNPKQWAILAALGLTKTPTSLLFP